MGWMDESECNDKKKKRECNCCLEIKDSIVVIICGEIDIDRLRDCLQTASEVKGNANFAVQE
ncbi:MAG: hypothetical protein BWY65_00393 [Firmicutes bacterium ADurb.Bin373]|nr:hypothetical protein [Bacillota bacterium]OQA10799.1 MAG: hypothetical protein BWY65_00393 [Firmicutes bacterium ADurb.Bin373]